MKIKASILLSSVLFYLNTCCQGQDSIHLRLPIYRVNTCIYELLSTVEESNKQYYNADVYFYSVIFKEGKKFRYMNIAPDKWEATSYLDYNGILKINNMLFLFRGDFDRDSLFQRTDLPQEEVKLKNAGSDSEKVPLFEPSLQGAYYECKGMPIYLEVYTKGKIPNFEMRVRPSKSE
jgi:hypothetical protein